MDEEMEEFVREVYGGAEIDVDYEFDAPQFWDFNREESDWEVEEAENWFRFAGSHPPSPFIIKLLNWQKGTNVEVAETCSESEDGEQIRQIENDSNDCMEAEVSAAPGDNSQREFSQDTPKAKVKLPDKSPPLSRSSTLMKPTASQLAKQIQRREAQSNRFLRRFGKKLGKFVENPQKSPPADGLGTKRQKLEAGYLRKVAELKHQPALLHKWPRKVGADVFSVNTRPRVTVPKEPNLETAHRAQRRRYKANGKPGEQANIHKARSPTPKKSTIPATEFQVFRLRTAARAIQQTYNNVANAPNSCSLSQDETTEMKGPNSVYAFKQERSEMIYKCAACSPKGKTLQSDGENGIFSNGKQVSRLRRELKFSLDKRFVKEPPTDLFSKLSLASEAQNNPKSQSKSAFAY